MSSIQDAGVSVGQLADQKIRIKLRAYESGLLEASCKMIMEAASYTSAKAVGPIPLPTKRRYVTPATITYS